MAIKTFLVGLSGGETSRSTLETALLAARDLDAFVTVVHVRPDPLAAVPAFGENVTSDIAKRLTGISNREASARADAARQLFEQSCRRFGVEMVSETSGASGFAARWVEETGRPDVIMTHRGRLADLIVVGKPTFKPRPATSGIAQAGLFETGRPVLIAPPTTPDTLGRCIAIAWNGSAESSRAVAAGTNFFGRADKVVVLTAESERTPRIVADELAAYLVHHGVSAETRIFAHMGERFLGGTALLRECEAVDADLLVMGAFVAHGLRELVMGNATQEVLKQAAIPVLMGH
jgi:nucleotide-binding universal stress UspA family protein